MKKALLKVLVLCIIICSALCVFTACTESPISFKVNFVVDEEIVKTIDTAGNEKISLPENPKKDGYDFDGWFWDKAVWEKPFTANSLLDAPLSSDMSVYAKFTIKHEHNYTAIITAPTCTERGYTTYTCDCGDSYIDDYVDELGHDFGAWIETAAPTCTTKGIETRYCSHDHSHTETRDVPKLQHEFTNYVSDNNATYDQDGTKTAHCNHGCGATDTIPDVGTKLQSGIAFKTLAVDGNDVYGKIPNVQTEFDFLTEIEKKGNVTYNVSRNLAGDDIIVSKTAEPNVGNNKYYILVYQNGELLSRYNVTIRRREIYDVTFNTDGGTAVEPQRIEEDDFATEPTTTRAGYTFTEWDYIFGNPITSNTVITAGWVANTDTKYKAEYYLQNLDDDNYTLDFTDNLTGETDKQATAGIKTYNHYTFNESKSIVSGNINGDETTILKVYYTRDIYEFTVTNENTKGGTIDCTDNGSYRFGKQINLSANVNDGYDFVGWFNCDTNISIELEYSFTLTEKTDIIARYSVHNNTKYTIETYLENLDGTYTKQNTEEKFGETDTTAIIMPNAPEHYTFNESDSVSSGNINGDGTTVLKFYYLRNQYNICIQPQDEKISLSASYNSSYKYGYLINDINIISLSLGYDFSGWYDGEDLLIKNDSVLSFMVEQDVNLVANYVVKSEMANFNFMSSTNFCNIIGLKNNTINEINIPNYVTSINDKAFSGCISLTKIMFCEHSQLTIIGDSAFENCKNLISIVIPDSVITIGNSAFAGTLDRPMGLISVSFGEKSQLTSIGWNAFSYCSWLTDITIPNSVTSIGKYAFFYCKRLESISIPFVGAMLNNNSKSHFGYIFGANYSTDNSDYVPSSIKTVIITGGKDLDAYAFYGCNKLITVILSNSITVIGTRAFYNCGSLTRIIIGNSIAKIENSAFFLTKLSLVYYLGTEENWANIDINCGGGNYQHDNVIEPVYNFNMSIISAKKYYYSGTYPQCFEENTYWHYDTDGMTPLVWVKEP